MVPAEGEAWEALYRLVLDYPLRGGKGLRPALCMAVCRALGGRLDAVRRSAAVLELYHNAFLVHDDVEDGSEERRGRSTLHLEHGIPIAINVGDAMLALSLQPLLDNVEVLGLGPALRVLRAVARMTRESVEGQATELDWIRRGVWQLEDEDYVDMVVRKTGWYSFITPITLGCLAAEVDDERRDALEELGRRLAVAFQIQDDVLNLRSAVGDGYGKETAGDLWEGKRTLILVHTLRSLSPARRRRCLEILSRRRPSSVEVRERAALEERIEGLALGAESLEAVRTALEQEWSATRRRPRDIDYLARCIDDTGSLDYASAVARGWGERAAEQFEICSRELPPSVHRDVLGSLVDYVHRRSL